MSTPPSSPLPSIPVRATEAETLEAFLDHHRVVLRRKAEGLEHDQLNRALSPTTMTLAGMLKHLTFVEYWWYREVLLGEPAPEPWASVDWDADNDWDWHAAAHDSPEELLASYDAACASARAAYAGRELDTVSVRESRRHGGAFSLRWIHVHMIEEYARHCGHADLLREAVDGVTGD